MDTSKSKKVSYLCSFCNQTRNLLIDEDVHLNRKELEINGLASYIDAHEKPGTRTQLHGVKLQIDANFHVRSNDVISKEDKIQKRPVNLIPVPKRKIKQLNTRHTWKSWYSLEVSSEGNSIEFALQSPNFSSMSVEGIISITSPLNTVKCKIIPTDFVYENPQFLQYLTEWLQAFVRSLELAGEIFVDIIPEILRYIDLNIETRITKTQEEILGALIDKSSIFLVYPENLKLITNSRLELNKPGLPQKDLKRVSEKIISTPTFPLGDIQTLLEDEILTYSPLEEEIIILSLAYLIELGGIDYKLSWVRPIKTTSLNLSK